MNAHDPRVGDQLTFIPSAFLTPDKGTAEVFRERKRMAYSLDGVVIYVNAAHRYYTVAAPCWGYRLTESFKF